MILDMEQHQSSLSSVGMSHYDPNNGGGGSPTSGPTTMSLPPPPLYSSPPVYNMIQSPSQTGQSQQQGQPQQSQQQQSQSQNQQPPPPSQSQQQQQTQQQLNNSSLNQQQPQQQHNYMPYSYNLHNLDSSPYLFSPPGNGGNVASSMELVVSNAGSSNYALQQHQQQQQQQSQQQSQQQGPLQQTMQLNSGITDLPDTKEVIAIEELCPVCGDKVSGYHYGLLTCESCKGFFKRTVQNKKVYTCVAERSCHIDKTQRKRCPYCRFQKCLEVGMKLEAVRADRMRGGRNKFGPMYKRDRARKLQMMRQRQIAMQTLMGSQYAMLGDGAVTLSYQPGSSSPFANLHIKQEIQIPQVSSLTSSPDSSPSPIAVALGQAGLGSIAVSASGNSQQPALQIVTSNNGSSQSSQGSSSASAPGSGSSLVNEHKLWASANSTTPSPSSKSLTFDASSSTSNLNSKVSPVIREFIQGIDDREWQNSLFSLLQNQSYNQCEVDMFELMCKVLDQNLFSQVDWARNSVFFKDLKVDDQMKLLQHSWSDMLVLDHIHQRMHNNLPDETTLHNGQKFDLLSLGLLGVRSLADHFTQVMHKLQDLKFDLSDYICVKFLLLLNHEVRGLMNRKHVLEGQEQVQNALSDYCATVYPNIQNKFEKLMALLPEIHELANHGEEHLYHKHCTGGAPTQTLLMEMLHAKRK